MRIVAVAGATACGKTDFAIEYALKNGGEVISCDSMQVYKYADIGTAKPSAEEMRGVPHHLLSIIEPSETYGAAAFARDAATCIEDVSARGKLPVVCGGTGLYLDALIKGLHGVPGDERVRERLQTLETEELLELLKLRDPESLARIERNDRRRLIRAAEVFEVSGVALSEHHRRSKLAPARYEAEIIVIERDRDELCRRIDERAERMAERGLVGEARKLAGLNPSKTLLQAVGYKELYACGYDIDAALPLIKQNTRRLAKRQLTWFRARDGVTRIRG